MSNVEVAIKKVGIVGEHPQNDAAAMIALLERNRQENVVFELVDVENFRGSLMDSPTFINILSSQLMGEDFSFLIVLRDLDFKKDKHKRENEKIKDKDKWFTKINNRIEGIGIFFLIIYELEALMLCDLETLNRYFQKDISFTGKAIEEKYPKEFLQKYVKYEEKDAKSILKKIDFSKVYQNHQGRRSFQTFANELIDLGLIKL